ncbi:MAG: hypothetical protein JRD05_11725 [Deltaproteobacteria bacterium]|nr:hypothetical protein [Deltaproteobacteria bacterium]
MQKFDPSCGISKNEIGIIKYNIKKNIGIQLPELPDSVETKLFLQGRDAWVFNWCLLNEKYPIESNEIVSLEVVAKLKREFHQYQDKTHYKFTCNVQIEQEDLYHPKVSITKKFA